MKAAQQSKASEAAPNMKRSPKPLPIKPAHGKPTPAQAMDLALAFLTENKIKPAMTLQEYADYTGAPLRQVQSDAERGYLPLLKRAVSTRRELKRVNLIALYALTYIEGFDALEKRAS